MAQAQLPDSLTPYADIARACGVSEADVINLLKSLIENGVIRRFGCSLAHARAGWDVNAMVAWKVEPDQAEKCAELIKNNSHISHVYLRASPLPDWPYSFYTMIHAQTEDELADIVAELASAWKLEYSILRTVRELKKTSPVYF